MLASQPDVSRTPVRHVPLRRESGFSLLELMIVVAVALIVAAFAVPNYIKAMRSYRINGDAMSINSEILLAKMRAAARFTRTRVYFDFTANTFRSQWWSKDPGNPGWIDEGVGSPQQLATNVIFGFGNMTAAPPGTQTTMAQAIPCVPGNTGAPTSPASPGAGADIGNTACITFNSRGFPVDNSGTPTGEHAVYITDGGSSQAVTLTATGQNAVWRDDTAGTAAANWQQR